MSARSPQPAPSAPARAPEPRERRLSVRSVLLGSQIGPFVGVGGVLLLLILFELATEPTFSSSANLTNILRGAAIPLVLAAASALVLLTAGVDLSIGSTLAIMGVLYAKLVTSADVDPFPALIVTLLVGGFIGFVVNGVLIGYLRLSFFVVTLATLSLYRGLTYLWTRSTAIDMSADPISAKLGNDTVLGGHVPFGFLVALAVVIGLYLVLRYTTFGRSIYAVGGNPEAAELSGVRTKLVVASVYGISGLCAALGAVMTIGYSTIADPNMGLNVELQVISAALLGGLALSGGVGSIWGAVLGVFFLQVLANALALAGASENWRLVVTGVILVLAVYLDRLRTRMGAATT